LGSVDPAPISKIRRRPSRPVILAAIAVGAALLLFSQGKDKAGIFQFMGSPVSTVRNGVLDDYNGATVGKAFEATFQNPKWRSFETPKGETVVEFTGTYSISKVDDFGCSVVCRNWLDEIQNQCVASTGLKEKIAKLEKDAREQQQSYSAAMDGWYKMVHRPGR